MDFVSGLISNGCYLSLVDQGYLFEKFAKALLGYLMWPASMRVEISLPLEKVYQFSRLPSDVVFAKREVS